MKGWDMRVRSVVVAVVAVVAVGLVAAPSVVAAEGVVDGGEAGRSLGERRERVTAAHGRVLELRAELRAAVVELRGERAAVVRERGREALGERPGRWRGPVRAWVRPGERPGRWHRLWGGVPGRLWGPRLR